MAAPESRSLKRRVFISLISAFLIFSLIVILILAPLTPVQEREKYYEGITPWQYSLSLVLFFPLLIVLYYFFTLLVIKKQGETRKWKNIPLKDKMDIFTGFFISLSCISFALSVAIIQIDKYLYLGILSKFTFYISLPLAVILSVLMLAGNLKSRYRSLRLVGLFLLVLLGIPGLWWVHKHTPSPRILPGCAADISALRTLASAQELYYSRYKCFGTFSDLSNTGMIDPTLASGQKSGLRFELIISGNQWSCTTVPHVWGETGERKCRIDNSGTVYRTYDENEDIRTGGKALK